MQIDCLDMAADSAELRREDQTQTSSERIEEGALHRQCGSRLVKSTIDWGILHPQTASTRCDFLSCQM